MYMFVLRHMSSDFFARNLVCSFHQRTWHRPYKPELVNTAPVWTFLEPNVFFKAQPDEISCVTPIEVINKA